jgi:hypothetical protein
MQWEIWGQRTPLVAASPLFVYWRLYRGGWAQRSGLFACLRLWELLSRWASGVGAGITLFPGVCVGLGVVSKLRVAVLERGLVVVD